MDYTKLPIWLICKYIWDHATGQVEGQTAIDSSIWDITQYSITGLDAEITSITVNAGVATIITDTAHGMSADRLCNITGVNSTYNGVHKVSQVDSTTQFRIQAPVGASTVASTTGNVAVPDGLDEMVNPSSEASSSILQYGLTNDAKRTSSEYDPESTICRSICSFLS